MKKYSHRERVLATLNHQKPDRVPIDLMGNASMLLDETYFNLRDHLNFPPIPPMRSGTTANYYDERILEYLDIDFRRIFLKKNSKNKIINDKDGSFTDEWGIEYRKTGQYVNAITHPLLNLKNKKEVENYSWPKAKDIFNTEGLAEEAKHLFNETDYALVARNPMPGGFLEHSCNLMSMESFFVSMMYEPEIIQSGEFIHTDQFPQQLAFPAQPLEIRRQQAIGMVVGAFRVFHKRSTKSVTIRCTRGAPSPRMMPWRS